MGHLYPQLTQFPANYADFLAAFRGGQTVDNNTYLTTADTVQTNMYKTATQGRGMRLTSGVAREDHFRRRVRLLKRQVISSASLGSYAQ